MEIRKTINRLTGIILGVWIATIPFIIWAAIVPPDVLTINIEKSYYQELIMCEERVNRLMTNCPDVICDCGSQNFWVYVGGSLFYLIALIILYVVWRERDRNKKEREELIREKEAFERRIAVNWSPPSNPSPEDTPPTPPKNIPEFTQRRSPWEH